MSQSLETECLETHVSSYAQSGQADPTDGDEGADLDAAVHGNASIEGETKEQEGREDQGISSSSEPGREPWADGESPVLTAGELDDVWNDEVQVGPR